MPTTEPRDDSGTQPRTGPEIFDTTSDERSPFLEYQQAVEELAACMDASGTPMTDPAYDSSTGLFAYDFDESNEATYNNCYRTAFSGLEAVVFETSPPVPLAEASASIGDWSQVDDDSWVSLLASFPLTASTRWAPLTVIDLERATEAFGIDRPTTSSSDARVFAYLQDLAAEAGIVPAGPLAEFGRSVYPDQLRAELGFDHRSFDRIASAGVAGHHLTVAVGSFDPDAVADAVAGDPIWSPVLEVDQLGRIEVYKWGSDLGLDLERMSPVRPVGHHRRLALVDDTVLWARWSAGIAEAVAAIDGTELSLADAETLRVLAELADDKNLFTAVLTASVAAFVPDLAGQRSSQHLVERPEAILVGDGVDGDGRFVVVAFRYGAELHAEQAIEAFSARVEQVAGQSFENGVATELEQSRAFTVEQSQKLLVAQIWTLDEFPLPPATELVPVR